MTRHDASGHSWLGAFSASVLLHVIVAVTVMTLTYLQGPADADGINEPPEIKIIISNPLVAPIHKPSRQDLAASASRPVPHPDPPVMDPARRITEPIHSGAPDSAIEMPPVVVALPDDLTVLSPAKTEHLAPQADTQTGDGSDAGSPSDLVLAIRAKLDEPCLMAAAQSLETNTLTLFGTKDFQLSKFAQSLSQAFGATVVTGRILVNQRQCGAINFLRSLPGYPAMGLTVKLERDELFSGQSLRGQIIDMRQAQFMLLMIDDNGIVHDLGNVVSYGPDGMSFTVPVARIDPPRDTAQLLVAISTDTPIWGRIEIDRIPASRLFRKLARDDVDTNITTGIAAFYLK